MTRTEAREMNDRLKQYGLYISHLGMIKKVDNILIFENEKLETVKEFLLTKAQNRKIKK